MRGPIRPKARLCVVNLGMFSDIKYPFHSMAHGIFQTRFKKHLIYNIIFDKQKIVLDNLSIIFYAGN